MQQQQRMMPGMHGGAGMPGMMPGMMPNTSMPGGMMPNSSMMGMTMPGAGGMAGMGTGAVNTMPGMMGAPGMMGMQQPAIPGVQPSVMPINPGMPGAAAIASVPGGMPAGAGGVMPGVPAVSGMPGGMPGAGGASQPAVVEWAIPQQKRVAYTAQFQTNDKARTGLLAAVQARNLLLQTGLAQQTLATVRNLADIDKDGKLSCEEFILAMHLCDQAMKGEPLPPTVPYNLVPPSMRKNLPSGVSTPGSVKSGAEQEVQSPASFEDKRRENWESGQAEF